METKMVVNLNKKRVLLSFPLFLTILILLPFVSSQDNSLSLFSNKYNYSIGENILIYANINNIDAYPVNVLIESLLVNENRTYPEAIIPHRYFLDVDESRTILLYNLSIDENFKNGRYIVEVKNSFNGRMIENRQISFFVSDLSSEIIFNTQICKDVSCIEKSKIFIKNNNIYVDYESNVRGLNLTASLTYPDKKIQQITLPASIIAEQIGTYTLEITASKSGYKTASSKEQFAVIEKEANIISINNCNANNICEYGETIQNCPQDCPIIKEKNMFSLFTIIFLTIMVLIIITLSIILYKNIRKRKLVSTYLYEKQR